MNILIYNENISSYLEYLTSKERAINTIKMYKSNLLKLSNFFTTNNLFEITKENLIAYKKYLQLTFKVSSVNIYLLSINQYFHWLGVDELKLKLFKIQTQNSLDNSMNKTDYDRMLRWAKKLDKYKMYCIMRTLAGTGIRIDELKYITVETIKLGICQVNNKGKIRNVILNTSLIKELNNYCQTNNIKSGIIFHGRDKNKLLDKSYIWRQLQYIAGQARVKKSKIYPHSFRHLFAKTYMETIGDLLDLADILGHSSLETTRIYTRSTTQEKKLKLDKLNL